MIDWRSIDKGFGMLANANPELKNYISDNLSKNNPDIKLLFDYRDTIEHRGTVIIEEFLGRKVEITDDYSIKIQDDPRDQQPTITRPLIKYANDSFHFVVKICDEVYALIIEKL